ncbi:MAG: ATP-binding protein [Candidatus Anammoxibacter sp.]
MIKQDTIFTTKADGTGLGLFECKIIIEKHRGKFYFESEVGVGSIFYVVLPRE